MRPDEITFSPGTYRRPLKPLYFALASAGFTGIGLVLVTILFALDARDPTGGSSALERLGQRAVRAVSGILAPWQVRRPRQEKTITGNLRQVASAADQYFIEAGATIAYPVDLFGTDRYIKAVPVDVAGENYRYLFPIRSGFTQLEVSKADGVTVRYTQ